MMKFTETKHKLFSLNRKSLKNSLDFFTKSTQDTNKTTTNKSIQKIKTY